MYGDRCYLNINRGVYKQHGGIVVQNTSGDYVVLCPSEAKELAAKLLELAGGNE